MEDITTIDLQQYIKKELFDETGRQEIWLHNLPNTSFLFDIINKLREKYKNETFVISQNINITNENINKEVLFLDCFFENEISFENCIFFENAYFINSIFNNSVCFTNSTFKNDVCFKKCTFIDNPFFNYSFENVIFEGENIDFSNSDFYNVNFSKTIFGKSKKTHISFEGAKLSNTFFEKAKFKRKILFNKSKIKNGRITEIQNTKFNEAIFFDQANFQDVIFLGSISFEKTQFKGDTFFLKAKFHQINNNINNEYKNKLQENNDIKEKSEVNFKKCNFVGNIYFSEAFFETDVDFSGSLFNTISFGNAIFDRNVRFHKTTFNNNIDFFNTSFNKLVEFYRAHFYKPIQFHFTDFLDRAIFSSTEFDEEVQFLHCTVDSNSYIRFESATFKKSLDISRSNFNDKANFWNIELEEGDTFISSKYQNDFDEKAKTESTKNTPTIYKKIRETYRIIKSNFYSQNNKIEALKFSKREILVYEKEVKSLSTDKILLLANKFSNNYGTNWVKGLLFTMLSGFITYSTILYIEEKVNSTYSILLICVLFVVIMSKTENIKEIQQKVSFVFFSCLYVTILCFCNTPFAINWELFIEHYLKVLNVIDLKPFEKEENSIFNLSGLSYLFLFIGRIFIGYGYYQTIQAFRKFGKS